MEFRHRNFSFSRAGLPLILFSLIASLALLAGQAMAQTTQTSQDCEFIRQEIYKLEDSLVVLGGVRQQFNELRSNVERDLRDPEQVRTQGRETLLARRNKLVSEQNRNDKTIELTKEHLDDWIKELLKRCCPEETRITEPNEIVGGFSVIREDSEPENFNTYGFQSSYTRYLNKTFGLTGDFSANFIERGGVDLSKYSVTGGVTVLPFPGANADDRVRLFTHALIGASFFKVDLGTNIFTDNASTMKLGGGLDVNVNNNFFIRPIQIDYAPTFFGDNTQHNVQFSFGAGVRFGGR
jgi:hypothetical protein